MDAIGSRMPIIPIGHSIIRLIKTYINYLVMLLGKRGISCVHLQKNQQMKIFVAGLPYDLDDAELEEIFEKFGTVTSAKVAIDKETGKSKGFAFLEMPNSAEAKDAIESMNDISLGKKPLVVKEAEERSSGPGGGNRPTGNRPGGSSGNRPGGGGSGYNRPGFNNDRNRY